MVHLKSNKGKNRLCTEENQQEIQVRALVAKKAVREKVKVRALTSGEKGKERR